MTDNHNYSGMWRCTHWYPSNERPGQEDMDEYYCQARHVGDKVSMESITEGPHHMTINLTVEHSVATGNWIEGTDPEGEYEGMQYSGAGQLLISEDGSRMYGKWAGVGREKQPDGSYVPEVYTGRWEMVRAGADPVNSSTAHRH